MPGTIITVPAGPSFTDNGNTVSPHCTLLALNTTDQKIVNEVAKLTKHCIETSWHVDHNGSHHNVDIERGASYGPNSEFLKGKVKEFKASLNNYIGNIKGYSQYLTARSNLDPHVDLKGQFNQFLYPSLRLNKAEVSVKDQFGVQVTPIFP